MIGQPERLGQRPTERTDAARAVASICPKRLGSLSGRCSKIVKGLPLDRAQVNSYSRAPAHILFLDTYSF